MDELRAETHRLTDEDTEESDDESSPTTTQTERTSADHHAFIFGYRSCDVDLRTLHPLPSQIPFIWGVYKENVDPIVKLVHVPTMNKLIREVIHDLDHLTPPTEALVFSIYYAAISSMDEDGVRPSPSAYLDRLERYSVLMH